MNRRNFFGAMAGVAVAPVVVKSLPEGPKLRHLNDCDTAMPNWDKIELRAGGCEIIEYEIMERIRPCP